MIGAATMAARALTTALAAVTLIVGGCDADSSARGASTSSGEGGDQIETKPGWGGSGGGAVPGTGPSAASPGIAGCAAAPLPAGTSLTGIWIGPAGEVWVAGDDGFVGRRIGSGTGPLVWSWCRPGPGVDLHAIWGAASDDIWAVGDGGTILRWNGSTWQTVTGVGTPAPGDLHDVWGEPAGSKSGGTFGLGRRRRGRRAPVRRDELADRRCRRGLHVERGVGFAVGRAEGGWPRRAADRLHRSRSGGGGAAPER